MGSTAMTRCGPRWHGRRRTFRPTDLGHQLEGLPGPRLDRLQVPGGDEIAGGDPAPPHRQHLRQGQVPSEVAHVDSPRGDESDAAERRRQRPDVGDAAGGLGGKELDHVQPQGERQLHLRGGGDAGHDGHGAFEAALDDHRVEARGDHEAGTGPGHSVDLVDGQDRARPDQEVRALPADGLDGRNPGGRPQRDLDAREPAGPQRIGQPDRQGCVGDVDDRHQAQGGDAVHHAGPRWRRDADAYKGFHGPGPYSPMLREVNLRGIA
jgi:hypothetical protein